LKIWPLLKKPFFGQFQKTWQWPSAYDDISRWQEVHFLSDSGAMLKGIYGAATTQITKGNIVCAHPMVVSAKGFFLKHGHANMFRDNGFNVLLFDINGFGESEDGDYNLPADMRAAGQAMAGLAPKHTVGYYGISFGAAMGVCACAHPDQPYQAALFESPFTSLDEFWRKYPLPYIFLRTGNIILPRTMSELRPIDKLAKVQGLKKILWVYGDADADTPPEMGRRFREASPVASDLWIVPGASHTKCFSTATEEFTAKAVNFFSNTLT